MSLRETELSRPFGGVRTSIAQRGCVCVCAFCNAASSKLWTAGATCAGHCRNSFVHHHLCPYCTRVLLAPVCGSGGWRMQTVGANTAMSILLTTTSNIVAVFTMPYVVSMLLASGSLSLDAGQMTVRLVKSVLLPLMVGAALRSFKQVCTCLSCSRMLGLSHTRLRHLKSVAVPLRLAACCFVACA